LDDIKTNIFISHSERKHSIPHMSYLEIATKKTPKAASKAKATDSSSSLNAALPKETIKEKYLCPLEG
jgi:hypothetical protein